MAMRVIEVWEMKMLLRVRLRPSEVVVWVRKLPHHDASMGQQEF